MPATVPLLPSLAEFPEEKGDKELNLKQGREKAGFTKAMFPRAGCGIKKKIG